MSEQEAHRLLIYPKPGELNISDIKSLIEPLREIGFIGGEIEGRQQADFFAGDRLIDLVTFLGCSPAIALSPEDGDNYCYVRLHPIARTYNFYYGKNTKEPLCRRCRQPQTNWLNVCADDYCAQCTLSERAESLVWKKSGALARTAIEVMNVYPHEAVPTAALLERLNQYAGSQWQHVYL